MAPASSAPRRAMEMKAPAASARRLSAATQKSVRSRGAIIRRRSAPAARSSTTRAVADLAGDGQIVIALKAHDRVVRLRPDHAVRLELDRRRRAPARSGLRRPAGPRRPRCGVRCADGSSDSAAMGEDPVEKGADMERIAARSSQLASPVGSRPACASNATIAACVRGPTIPSSGPA